MKNFSEYSVESAMDFIEAWEGCRLTAYKCPAGIWTIGVGHTGPDVHEATRSPTRRAVSSCARTSRPWSRPLRRS